MKAALNVQVSTNDIGIVLSDTIQHGKKTFTRENHNVHFSIVFAANSRRQDLKKTQEQQGGGWCIPGITLFHSAISKNKQVCTYIALL